MISTIIFDLSGVYLHGLFGSTKHIQKRIDFKITDSAIFIPAVDQLFLGQISEEEYWKTVIRKNSWNIAVDDLKYAVRKNFKEIKGTRKIIEKLRQNKYQLGLLSNHAKEWVEYCEITYKYHQLFHIILYSYEVALSKPSKDIFLVILKKLRAKPQECLFIDDYEKNLTTAKSLGIHTIYFTSAINLKKQLMKFKIRL